MLSCCSTSQVNSRSGKTEEEKIYYKGNVDEELTGNCGEAEYNFIIRF